MLRLKIKGKLGSSTSDYFDSCRDFYEKFQDFNNQLLQCALANPQDLYGKKGTELADNADRQWQGSVIFAVCTMEAFIYDYATTSLSAAYFKKYLDKLSLKAKWVIVPKLVLGNDFLTDGQAFEHFGDLVEERNELVHPKSYESPISAQKRFYKFGEIIANKINAKSLNPYQTVVEMLEELRKLEGDIAPKARWWELEETKP